RRIEEGDRGFHAARIGLLRGEVLDSRSCRLDRSSDPGQRLAIADLPADDGDLVRLSRAHDDPCCPLIHPQVERVLLGAGTLREAEDVDRQFAPALHVGGLRLDVAQRLDLAWVRTVGHCGVLSGIRRTGQMSLRSGPSGSAPSELSVAAWKTVLGEWIAWWTPACASRQNRCIGLSMRKALPPPRASIALAASTARHAARTCVARPCARSAKVALRPLSVTSQKKSALARSSARAARRSAINSPNSYMVYGSSLTTTPLASIRSAW